jgi:hypothetical protein
VKSEDDKRRYLQKFRDTEHVHLDRTKIEKNPALRSLAKLGLNSFWFVYIFCVYSVEMQTSESNFNNTYRGKFGQRSSLTQMKYFSDASEYLRTVFDAGNVISNVRLVNNTMACVSYKKVYSFVVVCFE